MVTDDVRAGRAVVVTSTSPIRNIKADRYVILGHCTRRMFIEVFQVPVPTTDGGKSDRIGLPWPGVALGVLGHEVGSVAWLVNEEDPRA